MDITTTQPQNPLTSKTGPLQSSDHSDSTHPLNNPVQPGSFKDIAEGQVQESHFLMINPLPIQLYWGDGTDSVLPINHLTADIFGPEPNPNTGTDDLKAPTSSSAIDPLIGSPMMDLSTGFEQDTLNPLQPPIQAIPQSQPSSPLTQGTTIQLLDAKIDSKGSNLSPFTVAGTMVSGAGRFITTTSLPEGIGGVLGIGQTYNQIVFIPLRNNAIRQHESLFSLLQEPGRDLSRHTFEINGLKGGPIRTQGTFINPVLRESEEFLDNFNDALRSSGRTIKTLNRLDTGLTIASGGISFYDEYVNQNGSLLSSTGVAVVNALPAAAVLQLGSLGVDIPFSYIDPDLPTPSIFDGTVVNGVRFISAGLESGISGDIQPIETVVNRVNSGSTGGYANLIADAGSAFGKSFLTPIFTGDINDVELSPIQTFTENLQNGEYGFFGKAVVYTSPLGIVAVSLFGKNGTFGKNGLFGK